MDKNIWQKRFLVFTLQQWLWIIVIVPGVTFVTASLFIIGYSNIPWPLGNKIKMASVGNNIAELIVLVHGKGDSPSSWAEGFALDLESSLLNDQQQVVIVDWGAYSKDLFRSTLNARRIGHDLGQKLSAQKNIKRLHLIGHSAGSFVVYGMCEAIKKRNGNIFIQTTYLDPVSIYGGVNWGYGTRHFGSCADISDAYIDRDDTVPGSNEPLQHPHTFDVTALKEAAGFKGSPHLWPIYYYRQAVLNQTLPYWEPEKEDFLAYPPRQNTKL
ncbi:MAG: alpha/beta fold hydrolase [Proteobacteria bacterium]|nr:alpha/beta fold hydrolase [Pseudomonadota bacterium]MBU1715687.1 alpha/beta fold hydrolase [Pseudomonadota bacterium]